MHVQLGRAVDLLDEAVLHDDDAGTHGHGFRLVVGNIDEGGVQALVQLADFNTHLDTELGVEVGQRFVHQEDFRITDDGTAEGNALALAAGEGLRFSLEQVGDVEDLGSLGHAALDFVFRELSKLEAESHVVIDRHMRIQSIVLENHRDVAVLGLDIIDQAIADIAFAVADFLETGDHAQGGRLAAAGRTNQDDEFFIRDFDVEIADGDDITFVTFVDIFQNNTGH